MSFLTNFSPRDLTGPDASKPNPANIQVGTLYLAEDTQIIYEVSSTHVWLAMSASAGPGTFIRADGTVPFTGDESMGGHKLNDLANPLPGSQSAAPAAYVDAGDATALAAANAYTDAQLAAGVLAVGQAGQTTVVTGGEKDVAVSKGVDFFASPTEARVYILTATGLAIGLHAADPVGTVYEFVSTASPAVTPHLLTPDAGTVNGTLNLWVFQRRIRVIRVAGGWLADDALDTGAPGGLGVKLHARADLGISVANGAPVTAWLDQSGAGNDLAQANPAFQPTYKFAAATLNGRRAVTSDVDAARYMASPAVNLSGGYTVIMAAYLAGAVIYNGLWRVGSTVRTAGEPAANYLYMVAGTGVVRWSSNDDTGAIYTAAGVWPAGSAHVITIALSANASIYPNDFVMRVDGRDVLPAAITGAPWVMPAVSDPMYIGGGGNFVNSQMFGDYAEPYVHDRRLDLSTISMIERYLGARYGITVA